MDVIVPPKRSTSSDDDDVAFKVLNQDNLPITIIGETIFKPFGTDQQKLKPNVIVHPTRRIPITNLEDNKQKPFTKSTDFIKDTQLDKKLRRKLSKSQGHLNHQNSAVKTKNDDSKQHIDTKFTRTLDAKLKKLQQEASRFQQGHNKKIQQQDDRNIKKPFVTTVKTGEFLEPPSDIANLLRIRNHEPYAIEKKERKLYAYCSKPRVLDRFPQKNVHVQKCSAAFAAARIAGGVAGVRSSEDVRWNIDKKDDNFTYANVMFDKRVIRGSNFAQDQPHLPEWNPHFAHAKLLSRDDGDGESAAARAAESRRRALVRRKARNLQYRTSQLRLGSPPPVAGRKHEVIQTENYLEELFVEPPTTDSCTQTDLFLKRPVSPFFVPAKTGADVETQIYPGDLFDFDMEVQPILEVLVGKTVEQALIEVLEEEELAALREQQRKFLELRAVETAEALRLEEQEKRLMKEKDRRVNEFEKGLEVQKEMEERIAAAVLMQGYMADLLPSVLEGLESEGFLMESVKQDIDESFMPWLMKEVTHELKDMVCSRDVLTDIVREILENRAELYRALYEEKPESRGEENDGPTLDDMVLQDHIKLQEETRKSLEDNEKRGTLS